MSDKERQRRRVELGVFAGTMLDQADRMTDTLASLVSSARQQPFDEEDFQVLERTIAEARTNLRNQREALGKLLAEEWF